MAVHAAQRQQMADIAADPTHPRWARVPRGRVTCAFCTMLAGRGFVYTSEEAAGGGLGSKYHNHCDCEPVPSWGEAKLAGYDPRRLDALYRRAKAGLPDGASYRDVLSRMRAQGGVTDSPAAQAGSGGGGKPPKPPKATAAAPEPDEPRKSGNKAGGIIDAAKASEHRAMCREILEKGNATRRYEALPAGEVHGYESWMDDQVRAETLKHDATWVRGGVSPGIDIEPGARPMEKEKACAERLSAAGFKVTFRATRAASKMRTSDLYILENGKEIAWEMKQPTGNGRQT
ncbi:MAG: hypothetical protein PUF97_01330, partial [Bifidobacteriaceae bacterium]|nr:hypothetical protein [Bifidobacteriaceae bacterium]